MTHEALRFLALNAVLHGYEPVDGFEGSLGTMAQALDISEEEAKKLNDGIADLPRVTPSNDEMTMVFLNFYRTTGYAFVDMGSQAFPLSDFVETDLDGKVSDQLRVTFIHTLLHDVAQDDKFVRPYILDGVLYCTPDAFEGCAGAMNDAYSLYCFGPEGTAKSLLEAMRKHTSLEYYAQVSAKTLLKIFRQMIRLKKHPVIFQQTIVNTPNLLEIYRSTGCIMAFRDTSRTVIDWVMESADGTGRTVVMSVEPHELKSHLVRGVRDLAGTRAVKGVGDNYKLIFPGVA